MPDGVLTEKGRINILSCKRIGFLGFSESNQTAFGFLLKQDLMLNMNTVQIDELSTKLILSRNTLQVITHT